MNVKRLSAGLMIALLLIAQLVQPLLVYAEVNAVSGDEISSALDDSQDASNNGTEVESSAGKKNDSSSKGAAAKKDEQGAPVQTAPLSDIDFVYVDQQIVALGKMQNIAVGFTGLPAKVASSELVLLDTNNHETKIVAQSITDGAALYQIRFSDAAQATTYHIDRVSFRLTGSDETYAVSLATDSAAENTYAFDVVSSETAEAFGKSKEKDGVTALIIKKDGTLEASDSVDDAISKADHAGVTKSKKQATSSSASGLKLGDSVSSTRENYLVVTIDPGHGGSDPGAVANGLRESDMNLSIAQHFYNELQTYTGVSPYLTRTSDVYVSLEQRVRDAVRVGSDVFISVHCNSADGAAHGSEVWVPNNSSYNNAVHQEGDALGQKIAAELEKLGLYNRGTKERDYPAGSGESRYPDGSPADYLSVIRNARKAGIPGIIIEHAFLTNSGDASFISSDANRNRMGIADATGVAQQYNLGKEAAARARSLIGVKAHVSELGWEGTVYDQKIAGTVGKNKNLEAFQASLQNAAASNGGIRYRSHVSDLGWESNWATNGAQSGTTGQNKSVEAIQMELTGSAANSYDIYYRVHSAEFGWLDWAKNGQKAGSEGYARSAQAIEVVLVNKGAAAPGSTAKPFRKKSDDPVAIMYRAHVRNIGWQAWVLDGNTAGTVGKNLPIEALQLKIDNPNGLSGNVSIQSHVENIGWQAPVSAGGTSGTTGRNLQIEAVRIKLSGQIGEQYDVYYRVHSAEFGWLGWTKNGEQAGSQGYDRGMQAIDLRLVRHNQPGPESKEPAFRTSLVSYQGHVSNIGWQPSVRDGETAGTTGRNLPLEALKVSLSSESGDVQLRAHVSDIGWQNWRHGGQAGGTTGQNKAMQAVQIKLTGAVSNKYDIYYRVHSTEFGWLDWAKNGAKAGSQGYNRAAQAIQIELVAKNGPAPGATEKPFYEKQDGSIMGASSATAGQMTRLFNATAPGAYPSATYASKGAGDVAAFANIVVQEAKAEGVRSEVVFCQAMYETGWFRFDGSVKKEQCNFGGLGATDSSTGGATFKTVREGIRAQVQHLKAYASTEPLNQGCVDTRFRFIKRGSARTIYELNGKWAVPGTDYGQKIYALMQRLAAA